jgi:hypothetical protein
MREIYMRLKTAKASTIIHTCSKQSQTPEIFSMEAHHKKLGSEILYKLTPRSTILEK